MSATVKTTFAPQHLEGDAQKAAGGAWWAFRTGLRRALRHWPLWLLFYLVVALLAGLLLLPLERALIDWVGQRLAAVELAKGWDGRLLAEIVPLLWRQIITAGPTVGLLALTVPLWPFLLSLPFVVLSGGALGLYATDTPRIAWKRFWQDTARYAFPFILLLLLEVILLEAVVVVALVGITAIFVLTGSIVLAVLPTIVLAALLIAIPWWVEYARVLAVVGGYRHTLRALGRAAVFVRRNFNPAAGLGVLGFLLYLLPYAPYYFFVWLLPSTWWPGQVLLQQLLVFTLVGTRLARLAAQVRLAQARATEPPAGKEQAYG